MEQENSHQPKNSAGFCWIWLPFGKAVHVYGIIMCNSTFLGESWSPNSSAWQFLEYAVCTCIAKESPRYLTSSTTDLSWSRKLCSLPMTSCTQKLRTGKRFSSSASCWIGIFEHYTTPISNFLISMWRLHSTQNKNNDHAHRLFQIRSCSM